jgi:WD40 repeat protein
VFQPFFAAPLAVFVCLVCYSLRCLVVFSGKVRSKCSNAGTNKTCRINVRINKKSLNEFSAVYIGQEIRAHKGLIWTVKFSPNGKYLAT